MQKRHTTVKPSCFETLAGVAVMKISLLQDDVQAILSAMDLSHTVKVAPVSLNEKSDLCHDRAGNITEVATLGP